MSLRVLCARHFRDGWSRAPVTARQRARVSSLALCLALWCLCPAWPSRIQAQTETDGAIAGQVLTASGSPVQGAQLSVTSRDTGIASRTLSDAQGMYWIPRLPPGDYDCQLELPGAHFELPARVPVRLGEVTRVNLRASASPAGTIVRDAAATAGFANELLMELPVDGGNWQALAIASPGAGETSLGEAQPSFRGMPSVQDSSQLDGTSGDVSFTGSQPDEPIADADPATDEVQDSADGPGTGTRSVAGSGQRTGTSYSFAQSAVREFRVMGQTSAARYGSALYGHGVGGVVISASRSGTSQHHGMIFFNLRDSAWAAVNPFAIASSYHNGVVSSAWVRPPDLLQQFGGRIGGPLVHSDNESRSSAAPSRLFYFYAFDAQHRTFPAISSPAYSGFYSLTATQQALLANRGVSAAEAVSALSYLAGLTGNIARSSDQTVNFGRLDWNRGNSSRIVFEYNRVRWSSPGGAQSGAVVDRAVASVGSRYGTADSGIARWMQLAGSRLSNEVRLQYGRELLSEAAPAPSAQEPNIGPGNMPPEIAIGPEGFVFGTPASLGQRAFPDERRLEAADDLVWANGRQLIQLGGDFSALRDFTDTLNNADGTFSYDSGATNGHAGGLVDWITDYTFNVNAYPNGGCPSIYAAKHDFCFRSYSQSFGQQSLTFHTQESSAFLQDDWRLTDRLVVHAGIRYEYQLLPVPQQPNLALDDVFGAVASTSIFPEDRNNIAPRLGLEWSPSGTRSVVVRAGYGLYYGKLPGATIRIALLDTAMAATTRHIRILPTTETVCPQNPQVGFGYPCSYVASPASAVAATSSAVVFDRRFRLPMVQQATLSIDGEIGAGIEARAAYVMNLDRELPNSVDINIAPSTSWKQFQLIGAPERSGVVNGEEFLLPVYTQRIAPSFGPVTDVISNANATYHGLTLEARRAFAGRFGAGGLGSGLEFRVAWTWSKAIDYGENSGATPRANGQFDPFHIGYDKGLSALNYPQRINGELVWSPRWRVALVSGRSSVMLHSILDGWSLAGIFYAGSGREYSYDIFGGTRLAGGRESINGSGGSVVLPTIGRNTLRLPPTENVNLRLGRILRRSERMRLRAMVEGYNVANHVNLSGVQQRAFLPGTPGVLTPAGVTPLIFQNAGTVAAEGLNVQPFGTFTASGMGSSRERQVQAGLRLEF